MLLVDGDIVEFFASELSCCDTERFSVSRGDPAGQQVWEALACLVAMRLWASRWSEARLRLEVRGDSVAMLSLVVGLRPRGPGLGLIAKELALCAALSPYTPVVASHVPGVANVFCDSLSRLAMDNKRYAIPAALSSVKRADVPLRDDAWWLSLQPPPVPAREG